MGAITLSNCPCLKGKTGPSEELEQHADPNCPQCQGSGLYETEEDMIKRSIE